MTVEELMAQQPVIPVLTVDNADHASDLAEVLVTAGLRAIEVTLRTLAALDSMRRMSKVKDAIVGAGTVLNVDDLDAAVGAGAQFIVTPGLSESTIQAAKKTGIPILPGVATASEIMWGLGLGLSRFKFFPAEQAGGRPMLDALRGPFGKVKFCPTGGITLDLARDYLTRPNVACVGGGWVAPPKLIAERQWDEIGKLAREAAALKRG
jgi:2-dehydro-3-deoxyphosphogluconate aldolase/(4S)-4-hydroxy-2-oxoglutarate aldolase